MLAPAFKRRAGAGQCVDTGEDLPLDASASCKAKIAGEGRQGGAAELAAGVSRPSAPAQRGAPGAGHGVETGENPPLDTPTVGAARDRHGEPQAKAVPATAA